MGLIGVVRRLLEVAVLTLMTGLAVVVVVGVGFRKFGSALVWYDEVASILLAWLTYYGSALAALNRGHIGVPTLVDKLEGIPRKIVVVVAETCVVGFFTAIAWAGWRVIRVLEGTTLVSLPSVPAAVAQSVIPIGAVLFVIAQLLTAREIFDGAPVSHAEVAPTDGAEEPAS